VLQVRGDKGLEDEKFKFHAQKLIHFVLVYRS